MAPLTNVDVQDVLARLKRITQPIVWQPRQDRAGYEIEVAVGFQDPQTNIWELGRFLAIAVPKKRVRCALLFANLPLRRLCDKKGHRNPPPDGAVFAGFHKHRWDDQFDDQVAYIPDDIRIGDVNNELIDFLSECNIDFIGEVGPQLFMIEEQHA